MGFFSGSTKVYVSSVVYNMAGDLADRPSYLKTMVLSNVFGANNFSMGSTIKENYMKGPGMQIRSFHRWTRTNYQAIGVPFSRVRDESDLNLYAVLPYVPVSVATNYVQVSDVRFGPCDFNQWAIQFMMRYHIEALGENWVADYDAGTNVISITRPSGEVYTLTPADFDPDGFYFYVRYQERSSSTNAWQKTLMWIYKKGSGIGDLDAMITEEDTSDEFVAFVPVRIENQFLSPSYLPEVYAQASKAYRKISNGEKFEDLVAKIAENESLADIDHAYVVHGVSLNTQDNAGKRYIFEFFKMMTELSLGSVASLNAYQAALADWEAQYQEWKESRLSWADEHPGEPRPPPPAKPAVLQPTTSVNINTGITNGTAKIDMTVKWKAAEKISGTGLAKPDAKVGDLWWGPVSYLTTTPIFVEGSGTTLLETDDVPDPIVQLFWQKTADSWESYKIYGLWHYNRVYQDKAVEIHAAEALADADESGFIIPLHYNTIKAMNIVDSTQVAMISRYLVFNCYKVVKQKWYQTGFFQLLIFVAIVAISVATGGAAAPGLLGTAGSVGAALGFTALTATIIGTIVNAIAAMILLKLVSVASVAIFGDKIGALIGAIAGFIALSVGVGLSNNMNLSQVWNSLGSAENLLRLTNSVGQGVQGFVAGTIEEIQRKSEQFAKSVEAQQLQLQQAYAANIGYGNGVLDPMGLTDTPFGNQVETSSQFLARTLLTGSDIAEISMGMISEFANVTLAPMLPGSA